MLRRWVQGESLRKGAAAVALAVDFGLDAVAAEEPLPVALEAFLRQAEVEYLVWANSSCGLHN